MTFTKRRCLGLVIFICQCLNTVSSLGEDGNIEYLLEMVEEGISASENYTIPKNNSEMLEITQPGTKNFGTFDFIVIGSGAGGGVVANRLTEIGQWNVLLLEAGSTPTDFEKITALYSYTFNSDLNWGDNSTSQDTGCLGMIDQICTLAHGKAVGGSTSINGVTVTKGHREDYDSWATEYGCHGWSFNEVLPYFKKFENAVFTPPIDQFYHGFGGYYTINETEGFPPINDLVTASFNEMGYDTIDYNGAQQVGVGRAQLSIKGNERQSVWTSYIHPFLKRKNFYLSSESFVTKILINKKTKTAYGVEFVKHGQTYRAYASKEVILSAGTYNSAQLLMLSGVGPRKHLKELGIDVIADLPVGQNLQEHAMYVGVVIRTNLTIYNLTLEEKVQLYAAHQEPLLSPAKVLAFSNFGDSPQKRPYAEFVFNVPGFSATGLGTNFGFTEDYIDAYEIDTLRDISIFVISLHPNSRGEVKLKSKSAVDKPLINSKFFYEEEDLELMYKGIQVILQMNETAALYNTDSELIIFDSPYCSEYEKYTKDWWYCDIRAFSVSIHHPISTNRMGPKGKNTVVSPTLKVHGIRKLRVVDASVLPTTISGHTMAPTLMIAEKIADVIKSVYLKK